MGDQESKKQYEGNFEEIYNTFMYRISSGGEQPDAAGNKEKRIKEWLYSMCITFKRSEELKQ